MDQENAFACCINQIKVVRDMVKIKEARLKQNKVE